MKKIIKNNKIEWHSIDQVFKKSTKSKAFKEAYSERKARIALACSIRETRSTKAYTQAEVARRSKVPQSVIARLESGEHSPSLNTLSKVAYALGKKIELV